MPLARHPHRYPHMLSILAPLATLLAHPALVSAETGASIAGDKPILSNPFRAGRSTTMSRHGIVASSHVLASQAGIDLLRNGGNAVDAALAAAATLAVVEPMMTGPGGDVFVLYYEAKSGKIYALNGSGRSPLGLSREHFADRKKIPASGWESVTVPGAVSAWTALHERFGRNPMPEVLAPAIRYAEEGYAVTEIVASVWLSILRGDELAKDTWLIDGKTPKPGQLFKNPRLGHALRLIAEGGHDAFYKGEIAEEIVRWSNETGGFLSMQDFANHSVDWVEPIHTNYRGYEVYQYPPNGQGLGALIMLNILEGYDLASMQLGSPEYIHLLVEAKKLAYADLHRYVADPEGSDIPVEGLLSKEYAAKRRALIQPGRAMPAVDPGEFGGSDTIYLTAIDSEGNAVSLVNSQSGDWGAGVSAGNMGFTLQDRGAGFTLEPGHPNEYAPGKRPFHTLLAGMITKDEKLYWSFGLMGGDMQPQGHVQLVTSHIDGGLTVQEAADRPRWRHSHDKVFLEWGHSAATVDALKSWGHKVSLGGGPASGYGGAQIIMVDPETGTYFGASDPRKDGAALGY